MIKQIEFSNTFKHDLKKVRKRGKNLSKLDIVVQKLVRGNSLEKKYKEHKLLGNYHNKLECHIEPD